MVVIRSFLNKRRVIASNPFNQESSHRGAVGWISTTDCLLLGLVVLLAVGLSLQNEKKEAEASEADSRALLKVANTDLGEQKDKNKTLSDGNDELSKENFKLNELLAEAQGDVDELEEQADEGEIQIEDLKQKVSVLDDNNKILKEGHDRLSNEKNDLAEKLKKLKSQIENLTETDGNHEPNKEIEELKSDNEQLESDKKKLESDKKKLESDKKKLESDKKKLESDNEELEKRHANENRLLSDEIDVLEDDLIASEADRTAMQERINDYEEKQREAKDDEILLRRELVGFKGDLQRVAFVIDCSGSMKKRWANARKTIMNWVTALDIKECVLFTFNDAGKPDKYPGPFKSGEVFQLSAEEKQQSIRKISQILAAIKPAGQTDTYDALKFAYQFPEIDSIVLFTDGAPFMGPKYNFGEDERTNQNNDHDKFLIQKTEELCEQNKHIPINVIGVGDFYEPVFAGFLLQLAKISKGSFIGRGD